MEGDRNYTIYFEVFGRRMKTNIMAKSESEARDKLLNKIMFHKIEINKKDVFNETMDTLDGFLGMLKSKDQGK